LEGYGMEKRTLTFSSSGFTYDVENPTRYTEELSYMLLGALNGAADISLRSGDDTETQAILDGEQSFLANDYSSIPSDITDIAGYLSQLESFFDNIEEFIGAMSNLVISVEAIQSAMDRVKFSLSDPEDPEAEPDWICKSLERLRIELEGLEDQLADTENSELLRALYAVAASNGFFVNTPGRISIEQVVEP
jgi:hypothetical protein